MKFSVIVADFPYSFSDKLEMDSTRRGADSNYSTLSINELKKLPIKELANQDGCILCLWCPSSLIKEGLSIMEAYDFEFKQTYIWVKIKKNLSKKINSGKFDVNDSLGFFMGRLFRQTHEVCLIGINNTKIYKKLKNKSQRSVSFFENLKHSTKPESLQDSLEKMFSEPNNAKLELFSRRQRKGWYCIGNESVMTKGEDIRDSLNKLNFMEKKYLFPINKVISCYDEEKYKELYKMWNKISCNK